MCSNLFSPPNPFHIPSPLLKPFYSSERQNLREFGPSLLREPKPAHCPAYETFINVIYVKGWERCSLRNRIQTLGMSDVQIFSSVTTTMSRLLVPRLYRPGTKVYRVSEMNIVCVFMFSCLVRYYCLYIPCRYLKSLFLCAYVKKAPNQEPLTLFVSVEITNKMQPCDRIYYSKIY